MNHEFRQRWIAGIVMAWLALAGAFPASSQTVSGQINNGSLWDENISAPPGDGDGLGQMLVAIQSADGTVVDGAIVTNGALPFLAGPYDYSLGGALADGGYTVFAWIDGDGDFEMDEGEPYGKATVTISASNSVGKVRVNLVDDNDVDGVPDWWEYHWFQLSSDPFGYTGGSDPDGDGLTNLQEYRLSVAGYGFDYLNPANWDSDGDGLDDGWECRYFNADLLLGLDPVSSDETQDFDGDGLSNWQEYCGIDGKPRLLFDLIVDGVRKAKSNSSDDLSPVDVDTDYDLLLDSFEAAWYDPANGIDPRAGASSGSLTNGATQDTSIARRDSDLDGLSNSREQCLLAQLRQASANGWIWGNTSSFAFFTYQDAGGTLRRFCRMVDQGGAPLTLNLVAAVSIPATTNRFMLRNHEWTDPTEGTGYTYVNEDIAPGHDTDDDGLPDGWEVQFSLDPRDDGFGGTWDNGPFGDPDNDGLMNIEEYFGQDGDRSVTRRYINGTGDETNPNRYNWRPDSTYEWRWYNESDPASGMGDPGVGLGISRDDTLGSALPTTSLGFDTGTDSDDDGINDAEEIIPTSSLLPSSPVDSCDPFIARSALITSSNGIPIPILEPAAASGIRPAGIRADLQRRDWTLECQVKLLGTNLSGDLFNFQTSYGPKGCIVYRLSLSNNAPVLVADNSAFKHITITANALPTNRWVHLAAVWDHVNNYLCLYIDGVLAMSPQPLGESFSRYIFPATNQLALAVSTNGTFVDRLMLDEVRIWGLARTSLQIAEYARKLVPPVNGDDVWIHGGDTDSVIVNGGGIFGREPGVPMENVRGTAGSYWLDDGDGQYDADKDVLLMQGSNLVAGLAGTLLANVYWNDKDNSGDFTRNALLAYYRFDDGGSSAEDFARRAKNGLMGVTSEEFRFGDHGYALSTNAFSWVTNESALAYGVDKRGADDSDHDGLPDAWEVINGLDPWEGGTWQESSPGAQDGPYGPQGDPDGDGLVNIYEYWSGTNPRAEASAGDGVLDAQQDRDGDGVVNVTEQLLGSRPDIVDTDDDGSADNEEQAMGTSPVNPCDPAISRAAVLGGAAGDYLEVPVNISQRLTSWTVEAWVNPTNSIDGAGIVLRRVVEKMAGGTQAVNYVMGLETNGGVLRAYAGYIWPDGKRYIAAGGVIPVGTGVWTHIAATFNELNAIQTLYTNGALAATITNSLHMAPPLSGRGGETFVRIGEDFGGALDEVRLWGIARTEAQIRANTNKVISATDTNGLVHYFRFDDDQANTNAFDWNEFHQPAGFQDFTYDRDWREQWRHAAVSRGSVASMQPGAVVPPPSLRIILQPEEAVLAGAQWSVDGSGWQDSSVSVQGLTPGIHTVMYKSVTGWSKPATETVFLTNGVATTFIRTYIQQASLVVRFDDLNTPADAAWRVNGGAWMESGMVVSNLTAGTNILSYFDVTGWFAPPIEVVVLGPGTTTELLREYTVMTSAVSAIIIPTNAVVAGAQWRVDGGGWLDSGAQSGGLSLSDHLVEFSSLPRWITPANITISPTNQVTVVVTGLYSQVTGLAVDIVPTDAVATGAQWRISGGNWTNSGVMMELPAGTYTVQFKPIGGSWLSPADITAVVLNQQVTELEGTYFRADIFGGNISTNLGDFWWPYGVALDAQHRLYVSDTWNDRVQVYDPVSLGWSLVAPKGTNVGQFSKPFGLTIDSKGNLFVADQNNNRIQKRVASNNVWVIVGSNKLGSALGQFNQPADVAVDSSLNLYVADLYNDRIQRLTTSGVWSVFVTNGLTPGRVYRPQGVMVDASDALYVTDSGADSNSLSRVQKFAKTGQFLGLLGDNQLVNGGMQGPAGTTLGEGNLYVADVLNNRVAATPTNGVAWTTLVGGGALSGPEDVTWDPRGYLYIADTLNSRILMIPITPGVETNGLTSLSALMSSGTNTAFTISWFGRLNWNYAVQYANTLMSSWSILPGATNIPGRNMMTNYTDTAVLGITNRFYRVIGY